MYRDVPNGNGRKPTSPPVGRSSLGGADHKKSVKGHFRFAPVCKPLKSHKTAKGTFGNPCEKGAGFGNPGKKLGGSGTRRRGWERTISASLRLSRAARPPGSRARRPGLAASPRGRPPNVAESGKAGDPLQFPHPECPVKVPSMLRGLFPNFGARRNCRSLPGVHAVYVERHRLARVKLRCRQPFFRPMR